MVLEARFWLTNGMVRRPTQPAVADKLDTIAKCCAFGRDHQRLECGQLNKLIDEVFQKMRLNHLVAAFAVVHYDKAGPPRQ